MQVSSERTKRNSGSSDGDTEKLLKKIKWLVPGGTTSFRIYTGRFNYHSKHSNNSSSSRAATTIIENYLHTGTHKAQTNTNTRRHIDANIGLKKRLDENEKNRFFEREYCDGNKRRKDLFIDTYNTNEYMWIYT